VHFYEGIFSILFSSLFLSFSFLLNCILRVRQKKKRTAGIRGSETNTKRAQIERTIILHFCVFKFLKEDILYLSGFKSTCDVTECDAYGLASGKLVNTIFHSQFLLTLSTVVQYTLLAHLLHLLYCITHTHTPCSYSTSIKRCWVTRTSSSSSAIAEPNHTLLDDRKVSHVQTRNIISTRNRFICVTTEAIQKISDL
jgi:hypothetical protein